MTSHTDDHDGDGHPCPYCNSRVDAPESFVLSLPFFYWHSLREHPRDILTVTDEDLEMLEEDHPSLVRAACAALVPAGLAVIFGGYLAESMLVSGIGYWFGGAWAITGVTALAEDYIEEDLALDADEIPADNEQDQEAANA